VTGVNELRQVRVVSAAPDQIRVSVLGGRTQLDVALPADVSVADFVPELARLISSRGGQADADPTDRDERRSFWVLSRVGGGVLAPDETLRDAGIANGDVLRLALRRALSPPQLFDDVVDATARLNKAAYAAWNATAAGTMAFAGLWLCAAAWVFVLLSETLSEHRAAAVAGAAFTAVTLLAGAALLRRVVGATAAGEREVSVIATAVGLPAIALSAALGWVLAAPFGAPGLAVACAILLALTATYYRLMGTGHWLCTAAAVMFAAGGLVFLGRALGGGTGLLATVTTTVAALGCLAVPTVTARLGRFPTSTAEPSNAMRHHTLEDPFTATAAETGSVAAMPSAEQVWARVRSAAMVRAGLLTGLATGVAVGAVVLMHTSPGWPALTFAMTCAAVLVLRSRWAATGAERAALAVPGTALVVIACVAAQSGPSSLRLAGAGVLGAIAVAASVTALVAPGGRHRRWVSTAVRYLDYVTVAALLPLALWPLGVYDRLGP
jgi:type VII secretion integral membrane protein EccD